MPASGLAIPGAIGTLGAGGEHTWADSLDIMGWRVDNLGLDVVFSHSIPTVVSEPIRPRSPASRPQPHRARRPLPVCCHPGGVKVIEALETVFGLHAGALDVERKVLRDFGNMSAPSVLFVLDRIRRRGIRGPVLMSSLGPGFSAAFQMVDLAGAL